MARELIRPVLRAVRAPRAALAGARRRWWAGRLDRELKRAAGARRGIGAVQRRDADRWRLGLTSEGLACHLDLTTGPTGATLSAVGDNGPSARVLRSALVGRAVMVQGRAERHVLEQWPLERPSALADTALTQAETLVALLDDIPHEGSPGRAIPAGYALTYWWDLKPNFGDVIGPWLVQHIAGRPVLNSRLTVPPRPSLYTVGSVIGHLDRPGHEIWGTGVIGVIGRDKRERLAATPPAAVHAVRGALTRRELIDKLGWSVPEVYGDPALLLPRYHRPAPSKATAGRVAIVPHYAHKALFAGRRGPGFRVLDAQDGLERVVDAIAAADRVVSTSLHGVIIAQAYEVPWVWLRIADHQLHGDTFKFEDFFTVLERSQVAELSVGAAELASVDLTRVASAARLPRFTGDLDRLHDAFPADGAWRHPQD